MRFLKLGLVTLSGLYIYATGAYASVPEQDLITHQSVNIFESNVV